MSYLYIFKILASDFILYFKNIDGFPKWLVLTTLYNYKIDPFNSSCFDDGQNHCSSPFYCQVSFLKSRYCYTIVINLGCKCIIHYKLILLSGDINFVSRLVAK